MEINAIPLLELNRRIVATINRSTGMQDVWITAETSDVRTSGGHCYLELLQKDPASGAPVAKARAAIWASNFYRINSVFHAVTGSPLKSDMKIMARVSVSFHAVYGLSLVISDINPDYTAGDLARRRNEIIARLKAEGVFDINRSLPWNPDTSRIAVISARGAAGYGDFINHLYHNRRLLRFSTTLFTAALQGERTSVSIISALEAVMERIDDFDCVVLIRGGGAVSDLASFDDYDLAANVAQFPLPVVVGIGHERDVTVLDYVANRRVKTPTAAAELLIEHQEASLDRLHDLGASILQTVADRLHGNRRQLAYWEGLLPALAQNVIEKNRARTGAETEAIITMAVQNVLRHQRQQLENMAGLIEALSPSTTLKRGYSITRINGHAVTDASEIHPGDTVETIFAHGASTMTVNQTHTEKQA